MRVALLVSLAVVAGCASSSSVQCGFGLCPQGSVCDPTHGLCVQPSQLSDCAELPDNSPCMVGDKVASCTDQVCLFPVCGDHIVNGTEQCDGTQFANGATDCRGVGFYDPGPITCRTDCTVDTTACQRTCGDGVKDPEESCDYSVANADSTCSGLGYYQGAAAPCTLSCTFDTSACTDRCGDGVVNGSELCEPDPASATNGLPPLVSCLDFGFDTGVATCGSSCSADVASCHHYKPSIVSGYPLITEGIYQPSVATRFLVGANALPFEAMVVRIDGTATKSFDAGFSGRLWAVSGTSASNVYAVGDNAHFVHYDGTSVTPVALPASVVQTFYAIHVRTPTDMFAVGGASTILHGDGTTWTKMTPPNVTATLYGVIAFAADDVWAAGGNGAGVVFHYNGSTWTAPASAAPNQLDAIWGPASNDVFAVGVGGTIVHYNGSSWSAMTSGTAVDLTGVWGTAHDDVIAIGQGVLLHYDGTRWTPLQLGANALAITGVDASHATIFDSSGTLRRWDGVGATIPQKLTPGTSMINDVWASGPKDAYASTYAGTFHYDGATWTKIDSILGGVMWGIGPVGATNTIDVFQAIDPTVRHYNSIAGTWTTMTMPSSMSGDSILCMSGTAANDVWIGTDQGNVAHYTTSWQVSYTDPVAAGISGIWARTANDIWTVGDGGIHHYTGTWSTVDSTVGLSAIWGTSATNIYAVGNAGLAMHYDGTAWTRFSLPVTGNLLRIYGTGPNDIFVGGQNALLHFNGTLWERMTTLTDASSQDIVTAIWPTQHELLVGGFDGSVHFVVRSCPTCF